jgi:hypothetical protein
MSGLACLAAGIVLGRRCPADVRRIARGLALLVGFAFFVIIVTGLGPPSGPTRVIHHWLPHGVFLLDWYVVAFSVGVILASPGRHPLARVAFGLVPVWFLGVIVLAALTGYLGPSHGQTDPNALDRFRVLHFWAWPALGAALWAAWYRGLRPGPRDVSTGTDVLSPES